MLSLLSDSAVATMIAVYMVFSIAFGTYVVLKIARDDLDNKLSPLGWTVCLAFGWPVILFSMALSALFALVERLAPYMLKKEFRK